MAHDASKVGMGVKLAIGDCQLAFSRGSNKIGNWKSAMLLVATAPVRYDSPLRVLVANTGFLMSGTPAQHINRSTSQLHFSEELCDAQIEESIL